MTLINNNYLETDIAFHNFVFLLFYLTDKKDFFFTKSIYLYKCFTLPATCIIA